MSAKKDSRSGDLVAKTDHGVFETDQRRSKADHRRSKTDQFVRSSSSFDTITDTETATADRGPDTAADELFRVFHTLEFLDDP